MRDLFLLVDYKGQFWCPHRPGYSFPDPDRMGAVFADRGWRLRILRFSEVDLRTQDYRDQVVLYQSSQDFGLHYKGYLEDVLLAMQVQGARLVPDFHLLRAHHNKVFMELLRDLSPVPEVRSLRARHFGTLEDLERHLDELEFPLVLKRADTDCGRGVALARDRREARRAAARLMRTANLRNTWQNLEKTVLLPGWVPHSSHRAKLVVQPFIPGLDSDYKALVFGPKIYVLLRPTRPGDFRASGAGGNRTYPQELPDGLLDFVERVFQAFRSPFASIDVMHDGQRYYLGEIQFVRFGTTTLLGSPHHFRRGADGAWTRVEGRDQWDEVFATCVADYLEAPA